MCCAWSIELAEIVPAPALPPVLPHCFGVLPRQEPPRREPIGAGIFGWPIKPAVPPSEAAAGA